jgi:glycogenin glucosyltransferase
MSAQYPRYACATLITTPDYVIGGLVLGYSVKRSRWPHETVALVTPDIGRADRDRLARVWDRVIEVGQIGNPSRAAEWGLASFRTVYTKLRLWELTDYTKLVFIDADAVVLGGLDDLLERPRFAAAPCVTAPDQFNSGVIVLEPSLETFADMMSRRGELPSYDGSDQGFLNSYFRDWYAGPPEHRLPLAYNVPRLLAYYRPAWTRLNGQIKVLHYFGPRKPWAGRSSLRGRMLQWLIARITSLTMDQPTPAAIWWELHGELEDFLRTDEQVGAPASSPAREF